MEAQGTGLTRLSPTTPFQPRGPVAGSNFASPRAWKHRKNPRPGCGRRDGHVTPAGGPGAGAAGTCACALFFLAWTQPLSALPPLSTTSPFPTCSPFPPPIGYVMADRWRNQSRGFVQTPARGTGCIGPMGTLGADAPQLGRGGPSGRCFLSWHVGGDQQPQRRRRRWRRRSLVFGVGSLAVARLLGGLGCQQRRPYGGGPRRHGATVDGLRL